MSLVAIAAGGTAGHINPALALAEELRSRSHEVHFYGTPNSLEARLVPQQGFAFEALRTTGFDRSRPWTLLSAEARILAATRHLVRSFTAGPRPDAAVGFGAFVSLPLGQAAKKLGIPLVLHEQNSVAGLANRQLSRHAAAIALATAEAQKTFEKTRGAHTRIEVLGNPVRRSILEPTRQQSREQLGIDQDAVVLLVFGGSKGARHINEAVCAHKEQLLARPGLVLIHATGEFDFATVQEKLALDAQEAQRWRLMPYIDDMGQALAAADVVLSRSGASSIAEIAARSVPALLVPYPYATGDHQTVNAKTLTDTGGAVLLRDNELDAQIFEDTLYGLIGSEERRQQMHMQLKSLGSAQAAARLADLVEAQSARPAGR